MRELSFVEMRAVNAGAFKCTTPEGGDCGEGSWIDLLDRLYDLAKSVAQALSDWWNG